MDALAAAGFDIAHAFDPAALAVPGLAILADARHALLIGNTRALWAPFSAALPALAGEADPLDRYTERTLAAAFPGAPVYYAHRRYADGYLPFQRLAVAAGLGALSPSQLVIHPVYGPWFALRAIAIVPGVAPPRAPIAQACTCTAACAARFAAALASAAPDDWRAVREACTLRAFRYSEPQIAYHYGRMLRSHA